MFRGKDFRKVLQQIGEIRSLVPEDVHMMCLTATAPKPMCTEIIRIVGMKNPKVFATSPSKPNICYIVKAVEDISEVLEPMMELLKSKHVTFPRTIIYCRKLSECGSVYVQFRDCLGEHFTAPVGTPDFPEYRVVDMFHSKTETAVKANILELFCRPSHLRVVIASTAFGMGIDCTDVHQIVHLAPPDNIESYI